MSKPPVTGFKHGLSFLRSGYKEMSESEKIEMFESIDNSKNANIEDLKLISPFHVHLFIKD